MILITKMISIMILKFWRKNCRIISFQNPVESYFEVGGYIGLTISQLKDSQSDFSLDLDMPLDIDEVILPGWLEVAAAYKWPKVTSFDIAILRFIAFLWVPCSILSHI